MWGWTDLDNKKMMLGFIIWRFIQALFFTNNISHPDEYWQAIAPAYHMVYGDVNLPWEWDPEYKLRSAIYPIYLAIPMKILQILRLDYGFVIRKCSHLSHFLLVILCDRALWHIGKRLIGKNSTRVSFFFLIVNRLYNDYLTRTFSNSIETIL